jgi:hypothetical protein
MLGSRALSQVFAQIAQTPGRKDKAAQMARVAGYEDTLRALELAYDPYVTFGLQPVPADAHGLGVREFDDMTWDLLLALADREITGGAARQAVADEAAGLDRDSADLLLAIINKDLRCGINVKSINAVVPGLVPEFSVALADKFQPTRIDWRAGVQVEPKLDGIRILAEILPAAGTVVFRTRNGREVDTLDHLAPALLRIAENALVPQETGLVLDGEVVAGAFNDTVSQVRSRGSAEDAVFHVFDVLPAIAFRAGQSEDTQHERRQLLEILLAGGGGRVRLTPAEIVHSEDEALAVASRHQAAGLEGAVVKDRAAPYPFKRDRCWQKIKGYETHDLEVVGVFEGEGRLVGTLGGLVCDYRGVQVRVGTGLSDAQRADLWRLWHEGALRGAVAEIGAHETTRDGSLRHPRLVRMRWDKS